jgi:hypothetical protein
MTPPNHKGRAQTGTCVFPKDLRRSSVFRRPPDRPLPETRQLSRRVPEIRRAPELPRQSGEKRVSFALALSLR